MKKYIIQSIYFSGIFIALNLIIYYFIVKPALFEKYIYNEKPISKYNVILVSDSHGAFIQNSPNAYGFFNLSYNSDNYRDMYLKIKYFSKFLSSQDTILLTVDNHQLSSYRNEPRNIEKSIIYADSLTEIDSTGINAREYFLKQDLKFLPIFNVDIGPLVMKYLYFSLHVDKMERQNSKYHELDTNTINGRAENRFKKQFGKSSQSGQQVFYLKKIIELCREKEITLIGFKFPIAKHYWRRIQNIDFGMAEILSEQNVPVIDMHDVYFSRNDYFLDQDHLTIHGGKMFCKELKARMRH
jgi:hypothetical protein